ncbi:hypothetical protein I7I50_07268 [Histoplasma capsulatum G186AR]|uniref:Uncharacterized protein n=1 Tax=Ajellomyces capsulatus TaxID=5037 RepID=A0A8H7Z059_AJECA|nr:hypothetical protein I7I52_09660 [Histoplasma capsulatum]QSS68012.1 hypothetical protein I7I50_07268 [Histoplasma capsulatum G186AR]
MKQNEWEKNKIIAPFYTSRYIHGASGPPDLISHSDLSIAPSSKAAKEEHRRKNLSTRTDAVPHYY